MINNYLDIVIFVGILDMGYAQFLPEIKEKPESCYGTNDILDRQCCIFPPFFNRDTAKACGALFSLTFSDKSINVTGYKREIIHNCEYWLCVLKKYDLLDPDRYLSVEKYSDHLDQWVNLNPKFSHVILAAKSHCKQQYRMYMPITSCEFFNFQSCIRHFVNIDCPDIIQNEKCIEWKQFYDECREFFL